MSNEPIKRGFFDRSPTTVAQQLLGKLLVRHSRRGLCVGRIVETEAYLARDDAACHAARGKTRKNEAMFGRPGTAYVYAIHSRWCFNVVTEPRGVPSAVLIRAIEPLWGLSRMSELRGTSERLDLARGPGRLCEALEINRGLNRWDLTRGRRLWMSAEHDDLESPIEIACCRRIGVTSAQDLLLRYFLPNNRFVSGSRREQQGARILSMMPQPLSNH